MLSGTTIHEAVLALADTTVIAWRISLFFRQPLAVAAVASVMTIRVLMARQLEIAVP